jgi:hypothetical protein
MGIVLKRRDNAHIVKKVYGGVIDIILKKQDLAASIEFLNEELKDLVDGKTSIQELVITKSIKASYKDPSKIAHKVLADRIGARDPGNRPCVNERIPFVYIKTNNPNSLQGDRIENPEYIVDNNLTPDYLHYITNQIMKPILQLYALCIEQLPGYEKDEEYWQKVDNDLQTKPMYQDNMRRKNRLDNLKLMAVKELLFDKYINVLTEPKEPKNKKAAKTRITNASAANAANANGSQTPKACEGSGEIIRTEKEKLKKPDKNIETGILKVDIKITKNVKTGVIASAAYISDGISKIWQYEKDNCKDKNREAINIITKVINYDKNYKYIIALNNKKFIIEYNTALVYYKEKEASMETNILSDIFNSQNIGELKIINNIRIFRDIIADYRLFSFITK